MRCPGGGVRFAKLAVALVLIAGVLPGTAGAETQLNPFIKTTAFATKTGFRAVVAWEAIQKVSVIVHFGTESQPDLPRRAYPSTGCPRLFEDGGPCGEAARQNADTAGIAILESISVGERYIYQLEDELTGERSAIGRFTATNAYNDFNQGVYTVDLLVQLDTQSLPSEIPHDLALTNIAQGMSIVAERLHDATDGFIRLGNVLVTDTNLEYAANTPVTGDTGPVFFCPSENLDGNLADVLVETTVPFDSHTFKGWSIADSCDSFFVGRLGSLGRPWGLISDEDLDFGYVAAHELAHYALNAPDLYPDNSDANCRNDEWDGSLMHNTGGWIDGRWQLTELDRSAELTPCDHGEQPYSWAELRTRYEQIPERSDGPIEHIFDTAPRGNPDGGALQIQILDREPGASRLTDFIPFDDAPCGRRSPQVQDAAGDSRGFVVTDAMLPSQDSLDIISGFLTSDPAASLVTFHIKLTDLQESPPAGSAGPFFRFYFNYSGARYQFHVRDPDQSGALLPKGVLCRSTCPLHLNDGQGEDTLNVPVTFDYEKNEVLILLDLEAFSGFSSVSTGKGSLFDGFEIFSHRDLGVIPIADTATGSCPYLVGQEWASPVSATVSTLTANPTSLAVNTGTKATATLKDASGNPVPGETVFLAKATGPGTLSISPFSTRSAITNSLGQATFLVKTTTAGIYTLKAQTGEGALSQKPAVRFNPGPVSAAASTVAAAPAAVSANGVSASTTTVTLKDAFGNPVPGKAVTLAKLTGPTGPTISCLSSPCVTSSSASSLGQVRFAVKSTIAGVYTFRAKDTTDNIVLSDSTDTPKVSFWAEENNPRVAYGWQRVTTAEAYGSSYIQDRVPGSSASYRFSGTSVTWYTVKGPSMGKADVYIDGVRKATDVNLSSSSTLYKQVGYSTTGLSNAAHTIKIVVKITRAVAVDAFKVGTSIVNTPAVTASWAAANNPASSSGAYATANLPGTTTTATFTFAGKGISWYSVKGFNEGQANVYIDGVLQNTVDNYASAYSYNSRAFTKTGLTSGTHTIKIEVLATKNAASTGTNVAVDRFVVS